jgi:GntR family transcriptional regulator/MocR family aminotransferase
MRQNGGPGKEPQSMKSMEPIFSLRFSLPERTAGRSSGGMLRSVHTQLRSAIQDGRLKAGLQLPPSRTLARTLGVSRNTVLAAYDLLLSEGYLRARRGAGTYVEDVRSKLAGRVTRVGSDRPAAINEFWRRPPPMIGADKRRWRYDFGVGPPDVSQFPFVTWRRLAGRAMRSLAKETAGSAESQGRPALRAAIATHVSFTRAIACEPDDIIVTAGAQQAFDVLARVLVTPGRTVVALEEAHYASLRHLLGATGARLAMVPLDDEGIVTERIPARASVVCVTPSHQFPLGPSMSLQRRLSLLRFARDRNACIIEDDYDGEYRFDGRPLDALQTLDSDGRVFYVGTFSKSMFTSLRLGYIVAPAWARAALVAAKHLIDRHSAVQTQDALASFIAEGHLARHVRKMTRIYAERRDLLLDALSRYCGDQLAPIASSAGLHITAKLLAPTPAEAIRSRAAEVGVKVQSVDQCCIGPPPLNGITFGYGSIATQTVDAGIRLLAGVIDKEHRRTRRR